MTATDSPDTNPADDELVLYRCTDCGKVSVSLGYLHGHIERHRGYTRLGIQLPFTKTSPGNFDQLMQKTQVLRITDYHETSLEEVNDVA